MHSVGTMFRELAANNGISVAEQSCLLLAQLADPNSKRRFDVDLDFRTCEVIAGVNLNCLLMRRKKKKKKDKCLRLIVRERDFIKVL
jgi:hypothetical protein